MSHKKPEIFPAGAKTVVVDGNGPTGSLETGTPHDPYLTIQAAIDARPATTSTTDGVLPWTIIIESGQYDENLTISSTGEMWLLFRGRVLLGNIGLTNGDITYAVPDTAGLFGEENILRLGDGGGDLITVGVLTVTAATTRTADIFLEDVGILDSNDGITGTGVTDTGAVRIHITRGSVSGNVAAGPCNLFTDNTQVDGTFTCNAFVIERTNFNGVFTGSELVSARDCQFSAAATFTSTQAAIVRDCKFEGAFDDPTSNSGAAYYNCTFQGLTEIDQLFSAVGCLFQGSVTVTGVPDNGFFSCIFVSSITFTGPALSFRVDAATYDVSFSGISMAGGATADILVPTAAPGATSVAPSPAEGSADTFARSDHVHQSNTAPNDIDAASTAAVGSSGEPARADHQHNTQTGVSASIGTSNAEGSSSNLARADHNHLLSDGVVDAGNCSLLASGDTTGSPLVVYFQQVAVQVAASPVHTDITVDDRVKVISVRLILDAGGTPGSTYTITNGTGVNDITEAIGVNSNNADDIIDAVTISDSFDEVPASGVLRFTQDANSDNCPGARIYVTGIRVA